MSGIRGVGAYNPYQLFTPAAQAGNQASAVQALVGSGSQATTAPAAPGGSFQNQLLSAISTAVQNAEQSGNTSNLKSVIQNAVNQVLDDNGMDPQSVTRKAIGGHGHRGQGASDGSSGATESAAATASLLTNATNSKFTGGNSPNSANPASNSLLAELYGAQGNQAATGSLLDVKQ